MTHRRTFVIMALALSGIAFCSTGCMTIVRGSKQSVSVDSNPQGASVIINGAQVGTTPMSIKLARKHNHQIAVEHNGRRQAFAITSSTDGGGVAGSAVGNLLVGGIIGFGVDAATGAMDELTPTSVFAEFGSNSTYTRSSGQSPYSPRHEPARELSRDSPPPPVTSSYSRERPPDSSWISGKSGGR